MIFTAFVFLITQLPKVYNEQTGCGCNVNRAKSNIGGTNNVFLNLVTENVNYCPVSTTNTDEELKRNKEGDMVLIPSGKYQFGTDDVMIESDKEGPKKIVKLKSFYLDKYEVSNKDFALFARSTNYKTDAEVFGDSFVFTLFLNSSFKEQLKDYRVVQALWWYKVDGANWLHPYGPDSNLKDLWDHPVVHVSWRDASKYCAWRNARLPTEAEWEASCRGGHRNTKYPWGDKLFPNHTYMANIWQGTFPDHNSAKDGYVGTNPVKLFPPNKFGLYNMAGNVWEWTSDSWDKEKPEEKVKKGGSYLCHRSYCYRYRCSARSQNTADSSAGNLGFRCARST